MSLSRTKNSKLANTEGNVKEDSPKEERQKFQGTQLYACPYLDDVLPAGGAEYRKEECSSTRRTLEMHELIQKQCPFQPYTDLIRRLDSLGLLNCTPVPLCAVGVFVFHKKGDTPWSIVDARTSTHSPVARTFFWCTYTARTLPKCLCVLHTCMTQGVCSAHVVISLSSHLLPFHV